MNFLDTETYNAIPLNHGTYKYTSTCECMIVTYTLGDDYDVKVWDRTLGTPMPADLAFVLDDPDEPICAHNAMFDRNVLRYALGIDIPIHRWRCSMACALSHGLPGGLDKLSAVFKLDELQAKHKSGRKLIQLFCKPQRNGKRNTRGTHPREWQEFIQYARADVTATRVIYRKLPRWNYSEGELSCWHLDQQINDRGIAVDTAFAESAIAAVKRESARLARVTQEITGGTVQSATQRDKLIAFILAEHFVELPDMKMATLERRMLDESLPKELRFLLGIRLMSAGTSTGKYQALVNSVQSDGRLRGTLQFAGAARTRRWAGRIFQPHNLPRPDMDQDDIDDGIRAIKANAEDLLYNDVMRLTRNTIRGCIVAPPGRKLVIADLSNIEGRVCAWLTGENWKLDAFRAYDAGTGPDLYRLAYAKAFNISPDDVDAYQRQIGKVMELMLQYQGGIGAWATGAAMYGIDLDALAEVVWPLLPNSVHERVAEFIEYYDKLHVKMGSTVSPDVVRACTGLKIVWRDVHVAIASSWREIGDTVREAIVSPGRTLPCRRMSARRDGAWLRVGLPGGRSLCYPNPRLGGNKAKDVNTRDGAITYMGVSPYTKQWERIPTYGGKILENACQSFAGDVLKAAMPDMEAAGYQIVLTVHDEVVTETPDTPQFNAQALSAIMAAPRPFTEGLPLAAKGFETYRYRKD